MAEVSVLYKDNVIATMDNGKFSKTLKTKGCYCEDDIKVEYSPNSRSYEITLSKTAGWVLLATLDAEVLSHINDATFSATLRIISSDLTVEKYAITLLSIGNSSLGKNGSYPVYGSGIQQTSETAVLSTYAYYPANNTATSLGLGGVGAFRVADGKYYVRHYDAYIHSGTYRLTLTW